MTADEDFIYLAHDETAYSKIDDAEHLISTIIVRVVYTHRRVLELSADSLCGQHGSGGSCTSS